ncbi:MAG: hypothetical protein C4536_05175 [Actinobacteria bacterium]|jgi:hypothetical protein|nr:MAG: hypothetical protein C4536_05175 [Actinomycetota bacterium]
MIQKATTRGLLLIISLLSLSLILSCGCNGKSLAERNKAYMDLLKKQGVGDPANRNKSTSEEYRKGYDLGYKNGYSEGTGDYARGEDFTPSSMGVKTGNAKYDEGFRVGNLDGYFDAYEDCIRIKEEELQLAASEEEASGEEASSDDKETVESDRILDYDAGYEDGYEMGLRHGEADKDFGFGFSPTPGLWTGGGPPEYERGFYDGYNKDYEKGYEGT